MPSNLTSLQSLFEDVILRIPDFQRGYSWEDRQRDDLWNDLVNINRKTFHFTGVITLEKINKGTISRWNKEFENINDDYTITINGRKRKPYFIVDGQQRLVSLVILLSLLKEQIIGLTMEERMKITNLFISEPEGDGFKYIFGYEKDTPSHQYLIGKIFGDKSMVVTEPETVYTNNLERTLIYFKNKLKDLNEAKRLFLLEKVTRNLLFNVFEIDTDKVDMSLVFETLNYRGKTLSKLELFKNRLIFLVSKRYPEHKLSELRERIVLAWQDIYEWLGKNTEKELDDDDFLRAFWIMFFNHDNRNDDEFKKFEHDIFYEKFRITDILSNSNIEEPSLQRLLKALSLSVKQWYFIHNPYFESEENTLSEKSKAIQVKLLNNAYGEFTKPLIMAYLCRNNNHEETERLYENIERHNYCVYLLAGKKADTNRPHILRIINQFYRYPARINHFDVMAVIREKTLVHLTFDNIYNHIHNNHSNNDRFFDWNGIKYTLWEWECELAVGKQPFLEKFSKAHIDLIFPEQGSHSRLDESFQKIRRQRATGSINKLGYSLGNITITTSRRMRTSFKSLSAKLVSGSYSDRDIANRYVEWSDFSILDRGMRILSFIEKRWNIQIGKENEKRKLLLDGLSM